MPSNVQLDAGAGGAIAATKQITHDGDTAQVQMMGLFGMSGTEDAYTAGMINGDATNGLDADVTRVIPGTAATSLGKAEDDAAASGDVGIAVLTVRQDTPAGSTSADGDYQPFKTDSVGRLHVNGSGVTQPVSDAGGSLTIDNAALAVVGGGAEATALRVTIASDSTGVLSVDDNGATLSVDDGGASLTVDGTVAVSSITTSVTPGSAATNLGKAEDDAHASGDVGVVALAVRRDTAAVGSDTDGDYSTLNVNAVGRLYATATIDAALPTGANTIGNVGVVGGSVGLLAGTATVGNVVPVGAATGGLATFRSLDLDETEEEIKGTAGTVYAMWVTNTATATRWIKFYNATAANVTVGTTTPQITIGIPGNTTDDITGSFGPGAQGVAFSTAITVAATTGVADNDTGAPGANDVIVNIFYV